MSSSKNVLLINPWIYDFTAYDFWLRPLGLLYIASLLQKYTQSRLHFIDCLNRRHPALGKIIKTKPDGRGPFFKKEVPKPSVLKRIPRKYSRYGIPIELFLHELEEVPSPDLVLLTCTMTYWYPGVQLVVELIRRKFGQVPVVLGGIYATLLPEHAKSTSGADVIFQGMGERGFLRLIREIFGDGYSPDIQVEALDEIPWPAFDLMPGQDVLPVLTSRGCLFDCSFCASLLLCKKFEQRPPSSVVSEIEYHHRRHGTRNFAFYDDALLLNKKSHIVPLLKGVIQRDLSVFFHTPNGLHIREIDSELATLFMRANVQSLFLSQESVDAEVLAKAGSKVSEGDLEKAIVHLERAGYRRQEINVYLMVGLPGQTYSSIRESVLHVQRLGAVPRLAYFSPVPGTWEWKDLVKGGYIAQDADPLLHNKLAFMFLKGDISPRDLKLLKDLMDDKRGQAAQIF